MTREERYENIYDAAMQCYPYEDDCLYGFIEGAKWADKNPPQDVVNLNDIWHDASEEPQNKNERILSYSEYFDCFFLDFPNYLMIKDGGVNKDWETVVLRNKMSKWAYVSDLLPRNIQAVIHTSKETDGLTHK